MSALSRARVVRRAAVTVGAVAAIMLLASSAQADARCVSVNGHYQERDTSGPDCLSPVGLCIAGEYRGGVRGPFAGQATSIVATADTPTTGVILFTSDSTITARIGNRSGTLIIKNAGAFRTVADGSIVDVQTIIDGTRDLAGATGTIRASGTFVNGVGESSYQGTVCRP